MLASYPGVIFHSPKNWFHLFVFCAFPCMIRGKMLLVNMYPVALCTVMICIEERVAAFWVIAIHCSTLDILPLEVSCCLLFPSFSLL